MDITKIAELKKIDVANNSTYDCAKLCRRAIMSYAQQEYSRSEFNARFISTVMPELVNLFSTIIYQQLLGNTIETYRFKQSYHPAFEKFSIQLKFRRRCSEFKRVCQNFRSRTAYDSENSAVIFSSSPIFSFVAKHLDYDLKYIDPILVMKFNDEADIATTQPIVFETLTNLCLEIYKNFTFSKEQQEIARKIINNCWKTFLGTYNHFKVNPIKEVWSHSSSKNQRLLRHVTILTGGKVLGFQHGYNQGVGGDEEISFREFDGVTCHIGPTSHSVNAFKSFYDRVVDLSIEKSIGFASVNCVRSSDPSLRATSVKVDGCSEKVLIIIDRMTVRFFSGVTRNRANCLVVIKEVVESLQVVGRDVALQFAPDEEKKVVDKCSKYIGVNPTGKSFESVEKYFDTIIFTSFRSTAISTAIRSLKKMIWINGLEKFEFNLDCYDRFREFGYELTVSTKCKRSGYLDATSLLEFLEAPFSEDKIKRQTIFASSFLWDTSA